MESVSEAKKQKVASYASEFVTYIYTNYMLCKYLFASAML